MLPAQQVEQLARPTHSHPRLSCSSSTLHHLPLSAAQVQCLRRALCPQLQAQGIISTGVRTLRHNHALVILSSMTRVGAMRRVFGGQMKGVQGGATAAALQGPTAMTMRQRETA